MSRHHRTSIARFKNKTALIGIFGLGYVGLPLMLRYSATGFRVLGFDVSPVKVDMLNAGNARHRGFEATCDMSRAGECDALIICVPTPLGKYREPDLSFVINTIDAIKPWLRAGQVVSLESTTYPGTTEEELLPRVEESGLTVGEEIFLVYSPEREDPGNIQFETRTIPKLIGGHTANCLDVGAALYAAAIDTVVKLSSTRAAEMAKLLENIHRAVNIGLVNEMKILAGRMDIDIFEVIDAAATKPFGFSAYYPGPGLGGHCIPIDPFYLTWKAREYGFNTRFIELAGEINTAMPEYVVAQLGDGLNAHGKALKGSRILVLGIAYKKNVDDMRESPAVEIMQMIRARGGQVAYSDSHVPVFPRLRKSYFELSSEPLTAANVATFDAVLLATDHDDFDYPLIFEHAQLIVDTRGKFREPSARIIRA